MKNIFSILICLLLFVSLEAQQDPQYTQFMFNKLSFNPAYAGSAKGTCITGLYRNQWVNFDGHPITQVLSLHTLLKNERVGLGIAMVRDRIGPSTSVNVQLNYAYRFQLGTGEMALGLMGNIRDYKLDFSKETLNDNFDLLVDSPERNKTLINAGAGVYYENQSFYAGLSIPRLIKNDISLLPEGVESSMVQAKEETHAFLMAGAILPIAEKISFKPAGLLKYAVDAPFSLDLHAGLIFYEMVHTGVTYRTGQSSLTSLGESIDLVMQIYLNDSFVVGGAFDFTLSELADYNSGSFEILLQYCHRRARNKVTNPRFF